MSEPINCPVCGQNLMDEPRAGEMTCPQCGQAYPAEYAARVWEAARDAAQCEDIDGDEKEAVSIIAAALEKQRRACAEAAYRCITEEWPWAEVKPFVLGAEVVDD